MLKLAFCLFNYSPYGGLERDFLRILETAIEHGHQVSVYVQKWQGEIPAKLKRCITLIPPPFFAFSNHSRVNHFVQKLSEQLKQQRFDSVIGFNRLPELDFYFAADCCYRAETERKHGKWYTLLPRFKIFSQIEKSVFSPQSKTKILLLNPAHQKDYIKYYQTPDDRFIHLLPGIGKDRKRPENQAQLRALFRQQLHVTQDEKILLMVCSNFKIKGVERAIRAYASLSTTLQQQCYLWIVGKGNKRYEKAMKMLAKTLDIDTTRLVFFGARKDVENFYASADILLHPAIQETAGMVLLEALVAALPIIVTENCGYAPYIQHANAGVILSEPFQQSELNIQLAELVTHPEKCLVYKNNAITYTNTHNLFQLNEQVIEIIENASRQ